MLLCVAIPLTLHGSICTMNVPIDMGLGGHRNRQMIHRMVQSRSNFDDDCACPVPIFTGSFSRATTYKALAYTVIIIFQICDFGSAQRRDQTVKQTTAIRTYAWMPPEVGSSTHWEHIADNCNTGS